MTDKIKSEDFIEAFGTGVGAKVENIPMKLEVSSPIVIDCKYYLPCGRCEKTNGFCSQLDEIKLPSKPNVTISTDNPFYVPTDNGGVNPL